MGVVSCAPWRVLSRSSRGGEAIEAAEAANLPFLRGVTDRAARVMAS